MKNMTPEGRKHIIANIVEASCIEYSTKLSDEKLMLCPTVCGVKFCGWYLTTTECDQQIVEFLEFWDGELVLDEEGLVK